MVCVVCRCMVCDVCFVVHSVFRVYMTVSVLTWFESSDNKVGTCLSQ
jgi:hypothetical protein